MSERAIQVGDMVQVVRWPHGCGNKLGKIYVVQAIDQLNPRCGVCNAQIEIGQRTAKDTDGTGAPLNWLKRIPPLSELESSKTDEPMKEPA